MGPKTDPWGMPFFTSGQDDISFSTTTFCFLFVKNDLIHLSTSPVIPNAFSLFKGERVVQNRMIAQSRFRLNRRFVLPLLKHSSLRLQLVS